MSLPSAQPTTPSPMGKGTLSRRLVVRTTALVAVVTVALSLFTALAIFQILQNQLDGRLTSAADRPYWGTQGNDQGPQDPAGAGLIRLDLINGAWHPSSLPDGVTLAAATQVLNSVVNSAADTNEPTNLQVSGDGLYRVLYRPRAGSATIVGLPYSEVTGPMASLVIMAALLTLGAIVIAYVSARRIVEISLRPLNRLTATATQVSNLPLDRGAGVVPIRVAPTDADPASETGQVGLAFNHMLDNVENALAARHRSETKVRQFVADASHELRNPLASIRGYAELTRRGNQELPEDTAYALGRIESESDRMSDLVEDLLLLARLDSEPTLELQPTDVTEVVLNAVSDARAADASHQWALDLPPGEVTVMADPNRLHQVVANLLGNARKHTPAGTHVQAALRAADGYAEIAVTDDGPGVPPEIQANVFERFTRADASRARSGTGSSTGLGLAIVEAVVKAHGGQVGLESRPGYTRFTVRIPLA